MKTAIGYLKLFCALVALALVGQIPAVRAFADLIEANRFWLLPLTLGGTAIGFAVLVCGWVIAGVKYGRPMSERRAKNFVGRFKGIARGREVGQFEWTFREMKEAWYEGTWWIDRDMRLKYFITAGGLLVVLSGFSVFVVVAEAPSVKVLMTGAVIYASVRTVVGFWRA